MIWLTLGDQLRRLTFSLGQNRRLNVPRMVKSFIGMGSGLWKILATQYEGEQALDVGPHDHAMKNMRAFLLCFLVIASICVFSGCATTNHDSYSISNDTGRVETNQQSPTEDMTTIEKIGYYVGWLFLDALYGWAGGNGSYWP